MEYRGQIFGERVLHSGNHAYLVRVVTHDNREICIAWTVEVYTPDKQLLVWSRPFEVWQSDKAMALYRSLQV